MDEVKRFPEYNGAVGPDPIAFSVVQLRIMAQLLASMGIYSIRMDPTKQDSPIHVQYIDYNEDTVGSRLYWSKDQV